MPFIPTEVEIDQFIAACQTKTAALLQVLKETAMRIGEAWQLRWTDLDFERNIIRLNLPEKRSKARIFNVSAKLIGMLQRLPRKSERIFGHANLQCKKRNFRTMRKRIAGHLQNPRFLQITFHTFRHWKATMLYHKTKDILYVREFLGHKRIENTLKYIQLEKALFNSGTQEFHVRVATNVEEASKLVKVGFEYVTGEYVDGGKIFRKRK